MTNQQQETNEQVICSNYGNPLRRGDCYCSVHGTRIIAEDVFGIER